MKNPFVILCLSLLFPLISQGQVKVQLDTTLEYQAQIYFDFGKDEIRNSERQKLQDLANHLKAMPADFVLLSGHTDSIGTDNNNLGLSERRAMSVINFLIEKEKVNGTKYISRFDGEFIPIAENDSEDGRQLNRRVEVSVYKINRTEIVEARPEKKPEPKEEPKEEPQDLGQKSKVVFIIKDRETNEPIQGKVVFNANKESKKEVLSNEQGISEWVFANDKDQTYSYTIFAEGYFHESISLLVETGHSVEVEVLMNPIKVGNKIALRNLYFYGNQAKLLPKSIPELKKLAENLALNPDVIVEIGGHINKPNTKPQHVAEWERELSWNRAKVVYEYLLRNGIKKERLAYKGYSNTQMVYPKAVSQEHQAANRRVELKVTGKL